MKDVYYENYEILMKEVEDDTKKWKDIPCSWTGKLDTVKMSFLFNLSMDSRQSQGKSQQIILWI